MRTLDGRLDYWRITRVVLAVVGSCAAVATVVGLFFWGVMRIAEVLL